MPTGRASLAADWFHRLGFSMPFGVNTADFILDLASGDVSTRKLKGQESRLHLIACAERYAKSHRLAFTSLTSQQDAQLVGLNVKYCSIQSP